MQVVYQAINFHISPESVAQYCNFIQLLCVKPDKDNSFSV